MSKTDTLIDRRTHEQLNTNLDTLTRLPSGKPDATLTGHLQIYILTCRVNGYSPHTISDYKDKVGRFVAWCKEEGITEPEHITLNDMRTFLLYLQGRMKPVSIHDYYRAVKRFLNWLIEEGALIENPMARIRAPKVPRHVIQPFTREQIVRMLAVCRDTFIGCRNQAIIMTFLDTGLRLSELANIQLADLDFDLGTIKVMGKGAKERHVRMSSVTQRAILKYWHRRKDNPLPCLWLTEEHRPLQPEGIKQMIRRVGKLAGITNDVRVSPHTFRHTAAIQYLRNKGDQFTLQVMLGHSSLEMTRRYVSSLGVEDMLRVHTTASPVQNWKL